MFSVQIVCDKQLTSWNWFEDFCTLSNQGLYNSKI